MSVEELLTAKVLSVINLDDNKTAILFSATVWLRAELIRRDGLNNYYCYCYYYYYYLTARENLANFIASYYDVRISKNNNNNNNNNSC